MTTISNASVPEPRDEISALAGWTVRAAGLGAAVWAISVAVVRPPTAEWGDLTAWFGAMVVVPLILRVTAPSSMLAPGAATWRFCVRAQPVAASTLGVAVLVPTGVPAGLLSTPWLVVSGAMAGSGLARVFGSSRRDAAVALSMMASLVGSVWLSALAFGAFRDPGSAHAYAAYVASVAWMAPIAIALLAPDDRAVPLAVAATGLVVIAGLWGPSLEQPVTLLASGMLAAAMGWVGVALLRGPRPRGWASALRLAGGVLWCIHVGVIAAHVVATIAGRSWSPVGGGSTAGFGVLGTLGVLGHRLKSEEDPHA